MNYRSAGLLAALVFLSGGMLSAQAFSGDIKQLLSEAHATASQDGVRIPGARIEEKSQDLNIGDDIISGGFGGVIMGVYPDGRLVVRFWREIGSHDYFEKYYERNANEIARTQGCRGGLCIGDDIISGNFRGVIKGIYPDGRLAVRFWKEIGSHDYFEKYYERNANEIARTQGCRGGLCIGDDIISGNFRGVVKGIYPDGRLVVRFWKGIGSHDYFEKYYERNAKDLARAQ